MMETSTHEYQNMYFSKTKHVFSTSKPNFLLLITNHCYSQMTVNSLFSQTTKRKVNQLIKTTCQSISRPFKELKDNICAVKEVIHTYTMSSHRESRSCRMSNIRHTLVNNSVLLRVCVTNMLGCCWFWFLSLRQGWAGFLGALGRVWIAPAITPAPHLPLSGHPYRSCRSSQFLADCLTVIVVIRPTPVVPLRVVSC